MALQTQGFALSALPRTPNIPDNVGKMDVPGLYDAVVKGLQTQEALRTTLARQQAADAQLALIPVQAAADTATANRTTALASPAIVGQEVANRGAKLDSDLIAEQNRRDQEKMLQGMTPEQRYILEKNGPAKFALSSTTPTGNGMLRSTSQEGVTLNGKQYPLSQTVSEGPYALNKNIPAGVREMEAFLAGLSPQDREPALRIKLGLDPRAAINKPIAVKGPDGSTQMYTYDPQTNAFAPAATAGGETVAPGQNTLDKARDVKTAELEAQRQALQPKAKANLETLRSKTDLINKTIDEAKALVSGFSTGYGSLLDRMPGTDARALKAKLDTIKANLGFDALTEMRLNSPTGGALGNVSDYEGRNLQSTVAALDTGVEPEEVLKALDRIKEARGAGLVRLEKAFEDEFTPQRLGQGGAASPAGQDSEAVAWAKAHPQDPRSAEILKVNGL